MKHVTLSFVAALSFAGCKTSGDCAAAIDNGMALAKADMDKMGVDAKAIAQLKQMGRPKHPRDHRFSR